MSTSGAGAGAGADTGGGTMVVVVAGGQNRRHRTWPACAGVATRPAIAAAITASPVTRRTEQRVVDLEGTGSHRPDFGTSKRRGRIRRYEATFAAIPNRRKITNAPTSTMLAHATTRASHTSESLVDRDSLARLQSAHAATPTPGPGTARPQPARSARRSCRTHTPPRRRRRRSTSFSSSLSLGRACPRFARSGSSTGRAGSTIVSSLRSVVPLGDSGAAWGDSGSGIYSCSRRGLGFEAAHMIHRGDVPELRCRPRPGREQGARPRRSRSARRGARSASALPRAPRCPGASLRPERRSDAQGSRRSGPTRRRCRRSCRRRGCDR